MRFFFFLWVKHVIKSAISLPSKYGIYFIAQLILRRIYQGFPGVNIEQTWLRSYLYGRQTLACQTGLKNANSVFEKHFPVTTLKSGILLQQFFHTSSYDNSFKCHTYVCIKSVGESITAKGKKLCWISQVFYVSGDVFFFFPWINVLIAPANSQDSAAYCLC